jgi:hypothetical protein
MPTRHPPGVNRNSIRQSRNTKFHRAEIQKFTTEDRSAGAFPAWLRGARSIMAIPDSVKKMWVEIQKRHAVPVNAIGVKIDTKDAATLKVWKDEGIDQFQKK